MLIYCIENTKNAKVYIGQTSKGVFARFKAHCKKARTNTNKQAIHHAILKYGESAFSVKVLQVCESQSEMDDAEVSWISKLNSIAPDGYNIQQGGYRNHTPTIGSRKKIAEFMRNRVVSEETCAAISKAKKGHPVHTKESRARISESHIEWFKNPENRAAQALAQTGRVHSDETKAKMVKSMTGLRRTPRTDEARANQSAGQIGKKHSEETRKKCRTFIKAKYFLTKRRQICLSLTWPDTPETNF